MKVTNVNIQNSSMDIGGAIVWSVGALIFSATMVIPYIISAPFWPLSWLLSFFTSHTGAISDAILIWYGIFIYFWASSYEYKTTMVVYFFGIVNWLIALAYGGKGVITNNVDTNMIFFMNGMSQKAGWISLGLVFFLYMFVLFVMSRLGHKKYLKKIHALEEAEVMEAAKYKKCPHCAETILSEANVCKHCGRDI